LTNQKIEFYKLTNQKMLSRPHPYCLTFLYVPWVLRLNNDTRRKTKPTDLSPSSKWKIWVGPYVHLFFPKGLQRKFLASQKRIYVINELITRTFVRTATRSRPHFHRQIAASDSRSSDNWHVESADLDWSG